MGGDASGYHWSRWGSVLVKYAIGQLSGASAALLVVLAIDYVTTGTGLNPFVALPIATGVAIFPYLKGV